jgi:hypothetical protein
MIELTPLLDSAGFPVVKMWKQSPSVYLDTCALRNIAECAERRERFLDLVRLKGGTLVLSVLSVAELTNQNQGHANAVAEMVDRVVPQVYFQESFPDDVLKAERGWDQKPIPRPSPDADTKLLPYILSCTPPFGGPFSLTVAFRTTSVMHHLHQVGDRIRGLGDRTLTSFEKRWNQLSQDSEWMTYFNPKPKRIQPTFATRGFGKAMMKVLFADKNRKRDSNDGVDLLHTLVPSAYCDFVVLDNAWCELVKQATRVVRKALIRAPIATPYGSGHSELQKFLEALETYAPCGDASP